MVAYSFKARFVDAIHDGRKNQTIRAERKRHARPGEVMQLYTAQRTRHCRSLGLGVCQSVMAIRLDFEDGRVEFPETGNALTTIAELDAFAKKDGFADWAAMQAFWAKEHGSLSRFSGVLLRWADLFRAL